MNFYLFRTPLGNWMSWGFSFFCVEVPKTCKTYSLLGIGGDNATKVIWLDILFFTFILRKEQG